MTELHRTTRGARTANALAVLLGCALALAMLEIALRVYVGVETKGVSDLRALQLTAQRRPPPYTGACGDDRVDARLGELIRPSAVAGLVYELKPAVDACYYGARVQTSRDGLRADREYVRPKPPATYRVLLLGDSQTFGQGVAYEETFGQQIERALAAELRGWRVDVINTAVDGYNLYQEAAALIPGGLSYQPDAIMILFIGNDLELPMFLHEVRGPFALDRLYAAELIGNLLRKPDGDAPRPPIMPRGLEVPAQYRGMVGIDSYRDALGRIGAAARERGIPVFNFVDPGLAMAVFGRSAAAEVRTIEQQWGIIDPPFAYPFALRLSDRNPHLNAEGHRRLAEQMLDALHANGVLPDGERRAADAAR